ncbi:MAG: polymer-forming cytoskeletal protein [Gemmatimonadales bacterium]|nr:polymer-forming cytoskeletal protein [Gemmatimonadales bacterium]
MKPLMFTLAILLATASLHAQDSVIVIDPTKPFGDGGLESGPPEEIVREAVRAYNHSGTVRFAGDVVIPSGRTLTGHFALFRGTLRVRGAIDGPVALIDGDLIVEAGGLVRGDVLIVGGQLRIRATGIHLGSARTYVESAPVVREESGLLRTRERRRPIGKLPRASKSFQSGALRTTLRLSTGSTYNRVEGLPVHFGPLFEWRASQEASVELDLRGILRTAPDESDLRRDLGYVARLGGRRTALPLVGIDITAHSEMRPIETQPLSTIESGWSAFLLQRDYRDVFEGQGYGVQVFLQPGHAFRIDLGFRRDNERSARDSDPWSLFRNSDRWRANPLIDDGHFLTASVGLSLDTRQSRDFAASGWWLRAAYEYGESDDVAPVVLPTAIRNAIPIDGSYAFSRLHVDARRYLRVSPRSRVRLRLVARGWVSGDPLPIQRRHSLGGPGLLPGYGFRAVTCTPAGFQNAGRTAFCDRMAVIQGEFRTRLRLGVASRVLERANLGLNRFIGLDEADLVFFTDAGIAWLSGDGPGRVPNDRVPSLDNWKADVGIGVDLGGLGLYLAKALTDGEPVRLTARLEHRF